MSRQVGPRFEIDAVCFDLLTALLDSWSLWEEVAAESGSPGLGKTWRHAALQIVTNSGDYQPYGELIAAAAREVGLPEDRGAILLGRWGDLQPWPEVLPMLDQIQKPLATATNCPEALARMATAKLGASFAVVVSAERAGAYKPDPRPYQLALDELGLPRQRVLFVAGSSHDAVGAIRMGMPVVWVNRLDLPTPAGAESAAMLTDLSSLPELIA